MLTSSALKRMSYASNYIGPLINLNVGGKRFSTSKETLTWISDSFFSSLVSGRISSSLDENGAIFIDRDPKLFRCILNFLRTKEVDLENINVKALKREAEFYGIHPLVSRLTVCEELDRSSCGSVLFHGMLRKPSLPHLPQEEKTGSENDNVLLITGHNSWIAVAYAHCILCYRIKESCGWHQVFVSPYLPQRVRRIAINAKVQGMAPDSKTRMVAVAFSSSINLWSFQDEQTYTEIGTFDMSAGIDALFFIGSQLVSTGRRSNGLGGRVGVWNAVSQHWQTQDVVTITSYDSAGSFLLLGCANGSIYYIDMQKFPLRLKDNDLLITELYRDQSSVAITALSVYLTPKTSTTVGNWIEVAYGTAGGAICVIVQHPELVGQGFQLFQTFTVHRNPVCKVMLSEKHLVSVCSDNNHVRTWTVTRFRGMISTQPGSMPLASFKILAMDPLRGSGSRSCGNDIGPHGEREEVQIFVQKLFPLCDKVYIRVSSNGERIAEVKSADGSSISCFCLHECEGSSRMGSRPRRYLFTGHANGTIQIWDITTALDLCNPTKERMKVLGGPTQEELLGLLGPCDLLVSPHHAPAFATNCSPSEISDLLDQILLRSSNQSLASTDTVDASTNYPSYKADTNRRPCFQIGDDQPSSSHSCRSGSNVVSSSSNSLPQHKRGHSESSPLMPVRSHSTQSRFRHFHSVSADSPTSPPTSPVSRAYQHAPFSSTLPSRSEQTPSSGQSSSTSV